MAGHLLTIIAPPSLEDTLVDWLLEEPRIDGFSTAEIYGHGVRQTELTLLEQVTGRQRRVQFQVQAEPETVEYVIRQMQERFANTGLYYFVTPVTASGRI
jgi:hypothetical protein